MLGYLRKRYVKTRLAAYLDGELSPASRRYIARLIDEHEDLYQTYRALRATRYELERSLPQLGRPDQQQMLHIWNDINTQLRTDTNTVPLTRPPRSQQHFSLSYGVAAAMCVVALLLAFIVDTSTVSASIPLELPAPQQPIAEATPAQAQTADLEDLVSHLETAESQLSAGRDANLDNTPVVATPGR